jgi:dGTPase
MKDNKKRNDLWKKLISRTRLFDPVTSNDKYENRSVFDMDHDRVVYSNYFRRMHDKTQVFPYAPLSARGQARSRLSHSLEVSCVGRSLGTLAGAHLLESGVDINPYDLGSITATACLAHDIGNPPFGHAGEDAIKEWAVKNVHLSNTHEQADILNFEGNAQGFRILTRLEAWQRKGGLRITHATLAAFSKYPCSSVDAYESENIVSSKKHGFIKEDNESFTEVFKNLGIPEKKGTRAYPRHPLAFLTEAADDICYAIVDLEDACHLGIISFETVRDLLLPIAEQDTGFNDDKEYEREIRLSRFRSAAISVLVRQCTQTFVDSLQLIEDFTFEKSLIQCIPARSLYDAIKKFSFDTIYVAPRVMEIESAGFKALTGLLDIFVTAVLSDSPSKEQKINRRLIPPSYLKRMEKPIDTSDQEILIPNLTPYERIISITDYISGMTDSHAIEVYQRLSGIKLSEY